MKFSDLHLAEPILRAVAAQGYTVATPVQAQAIPQVMAGHDVLGSAQTGTGKTAAFALPILQRLSANTAAPRKTRCLVLCPTRELAVQIAVDFRAYGKFLHLPVATVFGGVSQQAQVDHLRQGTPIVIATPGRLIDLMGQGHTDLRHIEVLVLDEADRMLDMGFIHDIRRIVERIPANRQTLLFSATMPNEIRRLADTLLRNPVTVQVAAVSSTAERIAEGVYFVEKRNKPALLAHLVDSLPMTRAIVFTRTKHGADRVVRHLHQRGIQAQAIHGNKSQNNRQRALDQFKANKIPVLVATDIASRGIDIDDITHVVNYDLTHEPETYVHRIGRTARAGASGAAISFCDRDEMSNLKGIERLIKRSIPVRTDHPVYSASEASPEISRPAHGSRHQAPASRHPAPTSRHSQSTSRHPASSSGHAAHKPQHAPAAHSAPRHQVGSGVHTAGRGQLATSGHQPHSTQHAPKQHAAPKAHHPATGHAPKAHHAPATHPASHTPKAHHPARHPAQGSQKRTHSGHPAQPGQSGHRRPQGQGRQSGRRR